MTSREQEELERWQNASDAERGRAIAELMDEAERAQVIDARKD